MNQPMRSYSLKPSEKELINEALVLEGEYVMNQAVNKTINNLKAHGFQVEYFNNREEAIKLALKDISIKESVGFGSSVTVEELGIFAHIAKRQYKVFNPNKANNPQTRESLLEKAAAANVYICSTNGITEEGQLINIDATGNRLSSMLYGHKRVFIFAGVNKISKNYKTAMDRIKNVACIRNIRRLNYDAPCKTLGKCVDCDSPDRICNATLVLDRCPKGQKLIVYLINESLGY